MLLIRKKSLKLNRRQIFSCLSLLLIATQVPAVLRASRNNELARLKSFITSTIGKSPAKRKTIAQKKIDSINPLKSDDKLIELAALGVIARESSTSQALAQNLPRRSKRLIDDVLETMPNQAWANALAGAWHYEVIRRSKVGATLLGASRRKGASFFKKATSIDPNDNGINLLEAISLIYDSPKKNEAAILSALNSASQNLLNKSDDYTQLVSQYASTLLPIAKKKDRKRLTQATKNIY